MARELLNISEEHIQDLIKVLRTGLNAVRIHPEAECSLREWIEDMESYYSDEEDEEEDDKYLENYADAALADAHADDEPDEPESTG